MNRQPRCRGAGTPTIRAGWAIALCLLVTSARGEPGPVSPPVETTPMVWPVTCAALSLIDVDGLQPEIDGLDPAADLDRSGVPDPQTMIDHGATIGEVIIRAGDIFDPDRPGENRRLFRWANRLHYNTRDRVIRRMLLFASGDPYDPRVLAESERLLRESRYLYDADIRPVRYEDGRVDIVVATRDVWTLGLGLRYSRGGGESNYGFGLEDSNFLGTGKEVTVRRTSDVDRKSTLYRYRDDNLLGSRLRLQAAYADNTDGRLHDFDLARPFYAFNVRRAFRVRAVDDERIDPRYRLGEIVGEFRHRRQRLSLEGGWSGGLSRGRVHRLRVGWTFEDHTFGEIAGAPPPFTLPEDRRQSYPWVEWQRVEDSFVEARDLDRIQRTEDLNLGADFRLRLGLSSDRWGGDRDQAVIESAYHGGHAFGPGRLLFIDLEAGGRVGGGGWENVRGLSRLRYYRRNFGRHLFFVTLTGAASHRLDGERQLWLGGDSGLRGYPLRFQTGDRRILLTLEQRFYTDWHVFKLFHVGAAVFADVGAAWQAGGAGDVAELGLLRDVGVGLRLGSSRSADAAVVHVDLAFPLDARDQVRGAQLVITSKDTF